MTSRMMRSTAVIALLALFGAAGGCGVGRKAAQEALEAAARNAAKNSDEAAQHALTAEEAARVGGDIARGAVVSKQIRDRLQDEQSRPDQTSMAALCPPTERQEAGARKEYGERRLPDFFPSGASERLSCQRRLTTGETP